MNPRSFSQSTIEDNGFKAIPDARITDPDESMSLVQLKDINSLSNVESRTNSRNQVVRIQSQAMRLRKKKDFALDLASPKDISTIDPLIRQNSQRSIAEAELLLIRNISSSSNYQGGQDLTPHSDTPIIEDLVDKTDLSDNGSFRKMNSNSPINLVLSKQPSHQHNRFGKSLFSSTTRGRFESENCKENDITPVNAPTKTSPHISVHDVEDANFEAVNRIRQHDNALDLEANIAQEATRLAGRRGTGNNNSSRATNAPQSEPAVQPAQNDPEPRRNENPASAPNPASVSPTATAINIPPDTEQVSLRLQRFYEAETKIYLSKIVWILFSFMLASAFAFLLSHDKMKVDAVFITGFLSLFVICLIDVFWVSNALGDLYMKSDNVFVTYDVICGTLTLIIIYFKVVKVIPFCTVALAPFILNALAYIYFTKASCEDMFLNIVRRGYFVLQTLLITLKIDGNISSNIGVVFMPSWAYVGVSFAKCLFHMCLLSRRVFLSHNLGIIMRFCCLLWYFLYYSINIVVFIILFGVVDAYGGPNIKLTSIRLGVHLGIGVGGGLMIFTILIKKQLIKFIAVFGLIKSLRATAEAAKIQEQSRTISFQVERKSNYFVMLSSTYFQPLQKNIMSKGREGFEKLKAMLYRIKLGQKYNSEQEAPAQNNPAKKEADVQALKQDKERFDIKFSKIDNLSVNTPTIKRGGKKFTHVVVAKTKALDKDDGVFNDKDERRINPKVALSLDDVDEVSKFNDFLKSPKVDEEEALCHLCYINVPDAILMGCGHGGICYDCAVKLINKKDECLECRGKVEAIYRIDPNPKFTNIIKGLEINKIIKGTS